jgi:hypothetical protein
MRDWLSEYDDRSYLRIPSNLALIWQQRWWKCTGKTFHLMGLPLELREIIYQHAFGSKIFPVGDDSVRLAPTIRQFRSMYADHSMDSYWDSERAHNACASPYTGFTRFTYDRSDPRRVNYPSAFGPTMPNYNILFVSKQVFAEASKTVWERPRKYFLMAHVFLNTVTARPPTGYNWLSRIELDFNLREWFDFFGIQIHPHVHLELQDAGGRHLSQIPTLRELRMIFPSHDNTDEGNPWGYFRKENLYESWFMNSWTGLRCI